MTQAAEIHTTGSASDESDAPLVKYEVTVDQIRQWGEKYSGLEATTREGYEDVRLAIGMLRTTRVGIEKRRVDLKRDALEYGRRVDSVAKQLTTEIETIEDGLKAKKAAVDDERERIKREKEAAEKTAVEAKIKAEHEAEEARLRAEREAEEARLAAAREAQRVEAERLAAERAAIERERAEAEAKRQETDEQARREREAEERRLAAERAQLEAERRAYEEARREAEHQEQLRQERIRAESEAKARAERERVEAEEARVREEERKAELARRLEALKPDADKLETYANALLAVECAELSQPAAVAVLLEAKGILASVVERLTDRARLLEPSE